METFRDNNFSPEQIRGINISVKGLSKNYPYITGWKLMDDYERYTAILYLDIFVDYEKLFDFYGVGPNEFFLEMRDDENVKNPSMILSNTDLNPLGVRFEDSEFQEFFQKNYNETRKIIDNLNSLYEMIPKNLQIFYGYKSDFQEFDTLCSLSINQFIEKK